MAQENRSRTRKPDSLALHHLVVSALDMARRTERHYRSGHSGHLSLFGQFEKMAGVDVVDEREGSNFDIFIRGCQRRNRRDSALDQPEIRQRGAATQSR